jgi:feruloyl esterase
MKIYPGLLCSWGLVAVTASAQSFSEDCANLKSQLNVKDTTIYDTEFVPLDTEIGYDGPNPPCQMMSPTVNTTVDLCRITAYTATSSRSGVNFEVWLPSRWTGRFISHGNGGLSGCKHCISYGMKDSNLTALGIAYHDLEYSSSLGFAAVSGNSVSISSSLSSK